MSIIQSHFLFEILFSWVRSLRVFLNNWNQRWYHNISFVRESINVHVYSHINVKTKIYINSHTRSNLADWICIATWLLEISVECCLLLCFGIFWWSGSCETSRQNDISLGLEHTSQNLVKKTNTIVGMRALDGSIVVVFIVIVVRS